jgi:hypothetical protein
MMCQAFNAVGSQMLQLEHYFLYPDGREIPQKSTKVHKIFASGEFGEVSNPVLVSENSPKIDNIFI